MERNSITLTIRKPLYGTFVYLRKDILLRAIKNGVSVYVKIPQGKAKIDPVQWIEKGQPMKKVFLRPDEPMELVGMSVPVAVRVPPRVELPKTEVETVQQQSLFDKPKRARKIKPEPPTYNI